MTTLPQGRRLIHSREPLNRTPNHAEIFGKSNSGPTGIGGVNDALRAHLAQDQQRGHILEFALNERPVFLIFKRCKFSLYENRVQSMPVQIIPQVGLCGVQAYTLSMQQAQDTAQAARFTGQL